MNVDNINICSQYLIFLIEVEYQHRADLQPAVAHARARTHVGKILVSITGMMTALNIKYRYPPASQLRRLLTHS